MKFLPAFLRKTQEIVILSHLPQFPLPTDSSPYPAKQFEMD